MSFDRRPHPFRRVLMSAGFWVFAAGWGTACTAFEWVGENPPDDAAPTPAPTGTQDADVAPDAQPGEPVDAEPDAGPTGIGCDLVPVSLRCANRQDPDVDVPNDAHGEPRAKCFGWRGNNDSRARYLEYLDGRLALTPAEGSRGGAFWWPEREMWARDFRIEVALRILPGDGPAADGFALSFLRPDDADDAQDDEDFKEPICRDNALGGALVVSAAENYHGNSVALPTYNGNAGRGKLDPGERHVPRGSFQPRVANPSVFFTNQPVLLRVEFEHRASEDPAPSVAPSAEEPYANGHLVRARVHSVGGDGVEHFGGELSLLIPRGTTLFGVTASTGAFGNRHVLDSLAMCSVPPSP